MTATSTTSTTTKPVALGLAPSFGFGDRLGLATPGHLESLRHTGGSGPHAIKGIFAQQSIREMTRTRRTPAEVMSAATQVLVAESFRDVWGADADHLKTEADVDITAAAGFVFYTIDPSGHVDPAADSYDAATLGQKFHAIYKEIDWLDHYRGKTKQVKFGPAITFDDATLHRAAVKYGRAIAHAIKLANYIKTAAAKHNQPYEIELSVDETPQPTTLAEHYIIAEQMRRAHVKLVSLAPRYIGEFEKGVDYKGDLLAFEHSLKNHAAIAHELGPYKLSLHSGSDKRSIYSIFAKVTKGLFHVKTAGTSYLEALRVVAKHDPAQFRRIIDFSRAHYDTDKATYHVSATNESVPPPSAIKDDGELERIYLERWSDIPKGSHRGFTEPGRQILHCTFGSVMTDATLGKAVKDVLHAEPQTYKAVLAEHFGKHLEALHRGM